MSDSSRVAFSGALARVRATNAAGAHDNTRTGKGLRGARRNERLHQHWEFLQTHRAKPVAKADMPKRESPLSGLGQALLSVPILGSLLRRLA
jgi:hypothetical protein